MSLELPGDIFLPRAWPTCTYSSLCLALSDIQACVGWGNPSSRGLVSRQTFQREPPGWIPLFLASISLHLCLPIRAQLAWPLAALSGAQCPSSRGEIFTYGEMSFFSAQVSLEKEARWRQGC